MSKEIKKSLVPKLRFPEFRDAGEWGETKLGKLAKRITLKNKECKVTQVLSNSAVYGVVNQRDYFYKDIANAGNLGGYFVVEQGDYIYNARTSTIAPAGPISKNKIGTGIVSPLYTVFRFKDSSNDFYEQYFKSTYWHQYMRMISNSGARHSRMSFSNNDFMEMPLPSPHPEEQTAIADCLSSVDELITAQTQKTDALKAHKKGLIQKLFPAEGETVPKLRFPEFRDAEEWKKVKLWELGELISGLTYSPNDVREKGLLVLRSSNVQNGRIVLEDNVYVKTDIKNANLSRSDDILICACNGSKALIGKNALIPKAMPQSTHGAFMTVFRSKCPKFAYQLFQTAAYKRQIVAGLGATINSINSSQLKKYEFYIPESENEQKVIADCLSSIDELITAQTQKIDVLKAHKKGLMQKIFPSHNEVNK